MLEKDDKIGDYNLVKFLGKGQFGEVWLAEKQLQFSSRKVRHALKFLSNVGDELNLEAASAEVDTWIEAGGHPNVMSVIDMLVKGDHIVIVSEFAEGGSLNGWLKRNGGKAPTDGQALEMMLGILRGIEHLHSRSVVHRDLKPDNILLQGSFPRITDFGISRIVDEGTMSTKAVGSPAYMSPESFDGSKSPATDIWSAGVIMYELLAGSHPFTSPMFGKLMRMIQEDEPKPLPEDIRPEFKQIIAKALQKDLSDRYQTASEMRQVVEQAIYQLGGIKQESVPTQKLEDQEFRDTEIIDDFEYIGKGNPQFYEKSSDDIVEQSISEKRLPAEEEKQTSKQKDASPPTKEKIAVLETQASPTVKTFDKEIERTVDWREVERQKQEQQQADFAKLSSDIERSRRGGTQWKKKPIGIIAGVLSGIIGLAAVGGFFWSKSDTSSAVTTANTSAANTANTGNSSAPASTPTAPTPTPPAPGGMAYVPGGDFTMGRDGGRSEAEEPAHKVSVKPFFMDLYEVSNDDYLKFLVKNQSLKVPKDFGFSSEGVSLKSSPKLPVVGVTWEEAVDYCKDAGKRLPTESEWEFAARGTKNFIYPWGNEWKQGNANVGTKSFTEVGKSKGASPFGIYDLVGNAWEWTADDFKAYPNGKLPPAFAGKTNLKTIRGGSFEATKDFATTTYRIGWAATGAETYDRTGFRCVQDVK